MNTARARPTGSRAKDAARTSRGHPQRRTREADTLTFLADLAQALAVTLDLRQTLSEAVTRVVDFMRVEAASLFLLDPAGEVLECRICVGPVDITGARLGVGQGVVGRAVAENATQIVTDAASDPRIWRAADDTTGFVTRSLVCAPLATAAGPIGAIEIVNRRDGKPFSAADAELLGIIAAPAALAINNARMASNLLEQQRLKREFDLARRLQKSLLPHRRRDDFPIIAVNRPAHEISGDFYDYFELADGRIGFVVGDISGKGLDAALLMVRAASLLRWAGKDGLAPGAWLARANEELCETARDGRFVCALVGYCDRAATRVQFAGAGFPPVIVHRAGTFSDYASGGPPLGILSGVAFDEHDIPLEGGTLYAFSDGATDVRDDAGQRIGDAGVRELIARHAQAPRDARLRGLLAELKHLRLVDDTTLLLVEAPRAEAPEVLLERRIPARAAELRDLRSAIRHALDGLRVAPELRDRLVLAVDEACANIIRHGYGPQREGDIDLRILRAGPMLSFELTDSAPCVDPASLRPKPLGECRCGGFGMALIDEVMDDWRIESVRGGQGNRLILRKRIEDIGTEEANEA
ncbi:ATP-binding SpoIIE family protein phosphatase [Dokdonella soli]|uniref:GAF domain-containing protein n=1 Tax=Dokdonella soli TaxID=529810 RepID=A0ABN1IIE9_9GAMM